MAVSWGHGDPKKDPVAVAYLDEEGRLREHVTFDNLQEQQMQREFHNMLKRRRPELIVISGFSAQTHKLYDQVRAIARDPDYLASINEDDRMREWDRERDDDEPISVPVRYVFDEVARLFQHSKRAEDEFGTLPVLTRYCIGLARYAQSPLNEYAALGADMIAVTFDEEGQHLV
jgi:transcription elongation factor SPT6